MLKLVKGYQKSIGLTETVLVNQYFCVYQQYLIYRNSAGTSRKCLVYPEFLVNSVCIKWTPLFNKCRYKFGLFFDTN